MPGGGAALGLAATRRTPARSESRFRSHRSSKKDTKARRRLIDYAFYLVEGYGVIPPVVQPGRACRLVPGHLLGDFKFATILQVRGNASSTEAVAGNLRLDACSECSALNHAVNIRLRHGKACQQLAVPQGREEGSRGLQRQLRSC